MSGNHGGVVGGNRQGEIPLTVFPLSTSAQPQGYATDATRHDMSRDSRLAIRRRVTRRDATHPLRGVALSRPLRCWGDDLRGGRLWTNLRDAPVWGKAKGTPPGCALGGSWSPGVSLPLIILLCKTRLSYVSSYSSN